MDNSDFRFSVNSLNTLKEYFRSLKKYQISEEIEIIKTLIVTQDKELKKTKRDNKKIRLEMIKLLSEKRMIK